METILICLLLLYNAWLVHYILFGRRQGNNAPAEEKPPIKPPETADDIQDLYVDNIYVLGANKAGFSISTNDG